MSWSILLWSEFGTGERSATVTLSFNYVNSYLIIDHYSLIERGNFTIYRVPGFLFTCTAVVRGPQ